MEELKEDKTKCQKKTSLVDFSFLSLAFKDISAVITYLRGYKGQWNLGSDKSKGGQGEVLKSIFESGWLEEL
jgi:hypothetical protein